MNSRYVFLLICQKEKRMKSYFVKVTVINLIGCGPIIQIFRTVCSFHFLRENICVDFNNLCNDKNKWSKMNDNFLPLKLSGSGSCVVNSDLLILIGGESKDFPRSSIFIFTGTEWVKSHQKLPLGMEHLSCVHVPETGEIHAIGGSTQNVDYTLMLESVHRLNH